MLQNEDNVNQILNSANELRLFIRNVYDIAPYYY